MSLCLKVLAHCCSCVVSEEEKKKNKLQWSSSVCLSEQLRVQCSVLCCSLVAATTDSNAPRTRAPLTKKSLINQFAIGGQLCSNSSSGTHMAVRLYTFIFNQRDAIMDTNCLY